MDEDRRTLMKLAGLAGAGVMLDAVGTPLALAQNVSMATSKTVDTSVLRIGYEDSGDAAAFPVILLHGFPDDARAYDGVVPPLVQAGYRAIVPYLRGYGPTRFLDPQAARMAEQAAIGQDVIDLTDALRLPRFAVAGYDWGGRAAAIAAAIHPDRVRATVLIGGYTIQNTVAPSAPGSPEAEHRAWYQWYFNTERGRAGLAGQSRSFLPLLVEAVVADVELHRRDLQQDGDVIRQSGFRRRRHSFVSTSQRQRARRGALSEISKRSWRNVRSVRAPSITLYGADDGVAPPGRDATPTAAERAAFTSLVARRIVPGVGHFMPRERPEAVSSALLELLKATG